MPRRVPIYGENHLDAPMLALEEPLGYDYVPEAEHLKHCFYLPVTGDWMTKGRLYPGDRVLVSPQETYCHGDLVVVKDARGEISIKRLLRRGKYFILQPDSHNPKHQLEIYTQGEVQRKSISIIGRVCYGKIYFNHHHK